MVSLTLIDSVLNSIILVTGSAVSIPSLPFQLLATPMLFPFIRLLELPNTLRGQSTKRGLRRPILADFPEL